MHTSLDIDEASGPAYVSTGICRPRSGWTLCWLRPVGTEGTAAARLYAAHCRRRGSSRSSLRSLPIAVRPRVL